MYCVCCLPVTHWPHLFIFSPLCVSGIVLLSTGSQSSCQLYKIRQKDSWESVNGKKWGKCEWNWSADCIVETSRPTLSDFFHKTIRNFLRQKWWFYDLCEKKVQNLTDNRKFIPLPFPCLKPPAEQSEWSPNLFCPSPPMNISHAWHTFELFTKPSQLYFLKGALDPIQPQNIQFHPIPVKAPRCYIHL